MIPHRQVLWNCINTVISWGLDRNDVSPVFTPLFHAGGLFAFLTPLFYVGGRIMLSRGFDVDESFRVITDERCTVILGVPTLFQMWRDSHAYRRPTSAMCTSSSAAARPARLRSIDAWRREKGVVFRQGYGLTEVGPNCFSMTDEESEPQDRLGGQADLPQRDAAGRRATVATCRSATPG